MWRVPAELSITQARQAIRDELGRGADAEAVFASGEI